MVHQPELNTTRDGFPGVRIEFCEHLDHDLVFSTRCAFLESKRNLPDSLTIDHRKGMEGFTRPSLLDPLRYFCVRWICAVFLKCSCPFRCSTFSVLSVSSTQPKTGALVCGGGPFKRGGAPNCVASLHRSVACFRLIFCHALCSAMERVFRFTVSFFPSSFLTQSAHSIIVSSCGSTRSPTSEPSVQLHS